MAVFRQESHGGVIAEVVDMFDSGLIPYSETRRRLKNSIAIRTYHECVRREIIIRAVQILENDRLHERLVLLLRSAERADTCSREAKY